nr:trypsin, alkaline C [Helicoverpa armigera]
MAVLALLTVALLAGSAYSSPNASRIVGGTVTSIEKFPSIVAIEHYSIFSGTWGQSCAANVLTSRYVLSAAHCFAGLFYHISYRRFRAGSSIRHNGGVVIYAEAAFNHPSYGQLGADGDISVVRLMGPLTYSPVIQQAAIPPQGFQIPDNLPVVHAGWGHTTEGGSSSEVLLETTIFTINNQLCAARYLTLDPPRVVTPNMICAGILDIGGKDACQGDSGGPLYLGDVLVGVVSWGHGCANETFPGVSTAVSPYTNWILSTAV